MNVTVLTALLVYFGWRRSETQAQRIGIDESILGMSTRDYAIRSVGPVLALLSGIAIAGLLWAWLDHHLVRWLRRTNPHRGWARAILRGLSVAWIVVPLAVIGLGFVWRVLAYVLFPTAIGVGFLLLLYGIHLRHNVYGTDQANESLIRTFVATIVAVCLFWTASNYAEVLGSRLAVSFSEDIQSLTGVVVYSERRLYLDAPGSVETPLTGEKEAYRYRYTGLRLLEHTGGTYFLVSDGWSPIYGVVIALRDKDGTLRFEFVRDRR